MQKKLIAATESDFMFLLYVRSGIPTHAYKSRLRLERSALDCSAILTCTWPQAKYVKSSHPRDQTIDETLRGISKHYFNNKKWKLFCMIILIARLDEEEFKNVKSSQLRDQTIEGNLGRK